MTGLSGHEFTRAAVDISEEREKRESIVAYGFAAPVKDMHEVAQRYGRIFFTAENEKRQSRGGRIASLPARPADSPTSIPDSGITINDGFFPTSHLEELWRLSGDVERRLIELGTPAALIVTERKAEPNPHVFKRGSASQLGEAVPRQFLEVLSHGERKPFVHGNGRLELARAIASP